MMASKVRLSTLEVAAYEVGVTLDVSPKGRQYRVKVNPGRPNKYQRINAVTGRKVNAVCWHGFRDFFRAVYRQEPDAKFVTAFDTWQSSDDFEARHRESGYRNVGSIMFPVIAIDNCTCPETGTTGLMKEHIA